MSTSQHINGRTVTREQMKALAIKSLGPLHAGAGEPAVFVDAKRSHVSVYLRGLLVLHLSRAQLLGICALKGIAL